VGVVLLFVLFVVVPIAELALFLRISDEVGLGPTLLFVLVTAVIGAALVRRQGLSVLRQVRAAVGAGGFPGRQLAHGGMVLVGGALLLTPGFITDAVGFSLMVPAVREALRRVGERWVRNRAIVIR
jgi:UPF0716 protein FxsA